MELLKKISLLVLITVSFASCVVAVSDRPHHGHYHHRHYHHHHGW